MSDKLMILLDKYRFSSFPHFQWLNDKFRPGSGADKSKHELSRTVGLFTKQEVEEGKLVDMKC